MAAAGRHLRDPFWFKDRVGGGNPQDYKQINRQLYEDFGNYNYGATGTAAGFPPWVLRAAAGAAQQFDDIKAQFAPLPPGRDRKKLHPEWIWTGSWGDEPKDQQAIVNGIYAARRAGRTPYR